MSQENTGFIINIKQPTRANYVACLVVTPKRRDGSANVDAKMERNFSITKAVQISHELLAMCGASEELLAQVHALAPEVKEPVKA